MKKETIITISIIVGIIILCILVLLFKSFNNKPIGEEVVKCISNKSILFIQTGCSHCIKQEELFGDKVELLNIVNCIKSPEICSENNIIKIPTWIINNEKYVGFYKINELKNITDC